MKKSSYLTDENVIEEKQRNMGMEKSNTDMDQSLKMALRLMEQPNDLGEEEIARMIADEECMQACSDLTKCKKALRKTQILHQFNVDKEWNTFETAMNDKTRKRRWLMAGAISAAASLFLILWFSFPGEKILPHTSVVVFQATEEPQQVILQTGNGKKVVLNNDHQLAALALNETALKQADSTGLIYASHTRTSQVEQHLLTTPRGKVFKVVLSDGTIVWLNAESRLEYPSQFVGAERIVSLQGEAYFQVASDKQHPFIVQANELQTRVLGTELNIRNYSIHDSHVTLVKGSVEVCHTKKGNSVIMKPGEDAHLQADGSFVVGETDTDPYRYWKEGFFYFDDMTLADIMRQIGRWYNISVVFNDTACMQYKMHYFCNREEGVEHAIAQLNRINKITVTLKENTVYIQ